ncbi:hypothetical protein M0R72_18075 [Candidatus Pacearchaeota archaeon]|nr:hypothetical protein [Candidatus Pacearchaeota archaeon]
MAKQKSLGDMVPEVPADVQEKADAYAAALRRLGNAKEKKNGCEELLIVAMKDADITEVRIDLGNKRIVLSKKDTLKIKKVKGEGGDSDGDEGDDE